MGRQNAPRSQGPGTTRNQPGGTGRTTQKEQAKQTDELVQQLDRSGVSMKEAKRRAKATVNILHGGGMAGGTGKLPRESRTGRRGAEQARKQLDPDKGVQSVRRPARKKRGDIDAAGQ
jgi:hypothetical protein